MFKLFNFKLLFILSACVWVNFSYADNLGQPFVSQDLHFKIEVPEGLRLIQPVERQVPLFAREDRLGFPLLAVSVHPGTFNALADVKAIERGITDYLEKSGDSAVNISSFTNERAQLGFKVSHVSNGYTIESRFVFIPWRKQLHYVVRYSDFADRFRESQFQRVFSTFEVLPKPVKASLADRDRALFIFAGVYGFLCIALLAMHQAGMFRRKTAARLAA